MNPVSPKFCPVLDIQVKYDARKGEEGFLVFKYRLVRRPGQGRAEQQDGGIWGRVSTQDLVGIGAAGNRGQGHLWGPGS